MRRFAMLVTRSLPDPTEVLVMSAKLSRRVALVAISALLLVATPPAGAQISKSRASFT